VNKQAADILANAQRELNELASIEAVDTQCDVDSNDFRSRILFSDLTIAGAPPALAIEYYGEVWDDHFAIALEAIANKHVAPHIASLRFTGPDEGANGSRTHDFSALLKTKAQFPNLQALYIRPTDVGDHNFVGVEDDQTVALLARCPSLRDLTLPQSPEPDFFSLSLPCLRYFRIGMAWQTHGFIKRMAAHHTLRALRYFDFADSLSVFQSATETTAAVPHAPTTDDMNAAWALMQKALGYDDATIAKLRSDSDAALKQATETADSSSSHDDSITPFDDFCALIKSPAIHQGMVLHLRNVRLEEDQFKALRALRPDLQLSLAIEAPHVYISHWDGKSSTSYKHLLISRQ
jgi:hypothetical protein